MNKHSNTMLFMLYFFVHLNVCLSESHYRIVNTQQGLVRGFRSENENLYQFYGIPYAKAPTGDDKFKGPLPPSVRNDILNATNKYVACPQQSNHQLSKDNIIELDCLHINIFMPYKTDNNTMLPVVLYLHGGLFRQGFGNEISPTNLVKRGVIVANINYRLGVYGFLCLGTEFAPGNAGLKDQVAALNWIKRNIANFGGDPENVSIIGNSAGSISVELLILSKMATGLFKRGISESGSATMSVSVPDHPLIIAEMFANQFGVNTNQYVTSLENFYKNLTIDELNINYRWKKTDVIGFVACVEKEINGVQTFLHNDPISIIKSGDYNKVDYVTGITSMEGISWLPNYDDLKYLMQKDLSSTLPIDLLFKNEGEKTAVNNELMGFYFSNGIDYKNYVDFFTDLSFLSALLNSARLHSHNMRVYVYLFSFNGKLRLPIPTHPQVEGPNHVSQAMYVQKFSFAIGYDNMTVDDYLIQNRMTTLWYNFIKFGKPVVEKTELLPVEWSTFGSDECFLNIDLEMSMKCSLFPKRSALWQKIYDKYGKYNRKECQGTNTCFHVAYTSELDLD